MDKHKKIKTIVSCDYGYKKIGLAVGNDFIKSAEELTTITSNQGLPNWAALDKIIAKWRPDLLLIGLPLNMNGTESTFSKQARSFGKQLNSRYNLEIEFEDERLSTSQADNLMRDSLHPKKGASKKLQSKRDQIAARLILESYFNRHG